MKGQTVKRKSACKIDQQYFCGRCCEAPENPEPKKRTESLPERKTIIRKCAIFDPGHDACNDQSGREEHGSVDHEINRIPTLRFVIVKSVNQQPVKSLTKEYHSRKEHENPPTGTNAMRTCKKPPDVHLSNRTENIRISSIW